MTTRETIIRYHLIINRLRKSSISFAEMQNYLHKESNFRGYNFNISVRTFKRDCEDIASIYGIEISFDFSSKAYRIVDEQCDESSARIMEAFDIIDTLGINKEVSRYVLFEKRNPTGTEKLYELSYAIKNNLIIQFCYHKFWEESQTERDIEPYALKEYKHRWYIVAKDKKDSKVKTFALDRVSNLEIKQARFSIPKGLNIKEYFKYSFGVITSPNSEVDEIILSLNPIQGKYIKTLPLHASQTVLVDNAEEFRIKLNMYATHDLKMELLSMGANVKVIQPESLKNEIIHLLKKNLKQYTS